MKKVLLRKVFIYIIFFIILSIVASIYSLLIYYGKVNTNGNSFNTTTFIIGIVCFLFLGFFAGKVAEKNGLLEGLFAALIIILFTLLINLFIKVDFVSKSFIKIVSYLTSSSLGGIVGINFRRKKD